MCAATASGIYKTIDEARQAMGSGFEKEYRPNRENAIKFLQLLFGTQGVALQSASGPAPITPPVISPRDFFHLPQALQSLVRPEWWAH